MGAATRRRRRRRGQAAQRRRRALATSGQFLGVAQAALGERGRPCEPPGEGTAGAGGLGNALDEAVRLRVFADHRTWAAAGDSSSERTMREPFHWPVRSIVTAIFGFAPLRMPLHLSARLRGGMVAAEAAAVAKAAIARMIVMARTLARLMAGICSGGNGSPIEQIQHQSMPQHDANRRTVLVYDASIAARPMSSPTPQNLGRTTASMRPRLFVDGGCRGAVCGVLVSALRDP